MPKLQQALKNEYSKRVLRMCGLRPPQGLTRKGTGHYRMPKLEANGGWLALDSYKGPEIPREEYESLTYTTYPTDQRTFFAPITSASGDITIKPTWAGDVSPALGMAQPTAKPPVAERPSIHIVRGTNREEVKTR